MLGVSIVCQRCDMTDSVVIAELQQVDENHSVVRYKFAFQWCEGQGDPWWTRGTEATPSVTQAKINQPRDSEPGVTLPEEQENLTRGRCLQPSLP